MGDIRQTIIQIVSFVSSKSNLIAISFCATASFFWMLFIAKWYYFRYTGGWDTAFFLQTLRGIVQGNLSPSVLDSHFLADHCHLLAFVLAPLYWIFPDPLLLQNIKILAFFAGAYVFFLILKKYLHPLIALGAMVAFTIAPANIAMLRFAFSYEALAVPIILLIFKAFDDQKYSLYIIACLLLIMVKEQMPLVVMGFGVFACLCKKEDRFKWALVPLLMGLAVFMVEVFVLLPLVRQKTGVSEFLYWSRYLQFGKTPHEIFLFLLTHPGRVWMECCSALNTTWYNDLFGVWGGFGLLSPLFLIPALPLFFKMALSSEKLEHSVGAVYYACVFTPFIFLATWQTLNHLQGRWRLHLHSWVIVFMIMHAFHFIPSWSSELQAPVTNNLLATKRFIDQIPPQASVLSSRKAMTYLANRERLYALRDYFNGAYYISGKTFVLPPDVDYLLIDFSELLERKYIVKTSALNFGNQFTLKESIEDVSLFVNNLSRENPRRLIEKSRQPFNQDHANAIALEGIMSLESVEFPEVYPQAYRIFPVTMVWKSLKKTEASYEMALKVRHKDQMIYEKCRKIGSTIYPTYLWEEGEYVKEDYSYLLPRLEQGEYTVDIEIFSSPLSQEIKCDPKMIRNPNLIQKKFTVQ